MILLNSCKVSVLNVKVAIYCSVVKFIMHDYLTPRDGQSFLPPETPDNMKHYRHRSPTPPVPPTSVEMQKLVTQHLVWSTLCVPVYKTQAPVVTWGTRLNVNNTLLIWRFLKNRSTCNITQGLNKSLHCCVKCSCARCSNLNNHLLHLKKQKRCWVTKNQKSLKYHYRFHDDYHSFVT